MFIIGQRVYTTFLRSLLCCGRTTVAGGIVVVLLLFWQKGMLTQTWLDHFLAWVEQQNPIVVLLPNSIKPAFLMEETGVN